MKLKGKVAIVTGAGSGIGKATALLFAKEGALVTVATRNPVRGNNVVNTIKEQGGDAIYVSTDVGNYENVKEMVNQTINNWGKIDILFNNAGIGISKSIFDMSISEWDAVIDTNLKGQFLCCKEVLPYMREQNMGVIINMSSVLAYATLPGNTAYTASKSGITGFTKALALDVGQFNIRVNAIAPGSIDTPMMWEGVAEDERQAVEEEVASAQPIGKYGSPEEIARTALFLASDDSSFASGACFVIDGGLLSKIATTR